MNKVILINNLVSSDKSDIIRILNILYNYKYEIVSINNYLKINSYEDINEDELFKSIEKMFIDIEKRKNEEKSVIAYNIITSKKIYDLMKTILNDNYLNVLLIKKSMSLDFNENKKCFVLDIDNKSSYEISSIIYDLNKSSDKKIKEKKYSSKHNIFKTGEDIDMLNDMEKEYSLKKIKNTCDNHWDGA